MPVTDLGGQVSIQDPRNPVLQEITKHPDYRVVAAFFLGWVLVSSAYCALSSRLIRELARRTARLCMSKRVKESAKAVEIAADLEDNIEKGNFATVAPTQQEVDANASLFILNLCFVLAALAGFCSLLNLGDQGGNSITCTVVIAWSNMASQSVRIVGLLMLSWRLQRLGAKWLETYALWFGLLVVLGLVFAVNATGTGAVSVVGPSGVSICYRQYFWPVALSLSGVVMFLEIYVAVRLFMLGTPRSPAWAGALRRFFSMEVARPMSLFVLDVVTVVQAAMWVDSLAQFVPFSLAALLVIGVFNYMEGTRERHTYLDNFPRTLPIGELMDAQRYSVQQPNSLLEPTPFLLHFMEPPMSPISHAKAIPAQSRAAGDINGGNGDLVLHISATSPDDGDEDAGDSEPPRSAPANLTETPQSLHSGPRHILPFQVQYLERLEREAAGFPTGPVPPRRDRPKVFIVIDEQEQEMLSTNRRSRASIIGSDIIRMTPTTPRKKRKMSSLLSPGSTAQSASSYASPRESRSTARTQMISFSAYPHVERSPTIQSEHPEQYPSPQGDYLSPEEPSRHFSWRIASRHQSVNSSRTAPRDELHTVLESSSAVRTSSAPSRASSRIQTRRLTFGQPVKPPPRRLSLSARDALPPIVVPLPAVPRLQSTTGSPQEAVSSRVSSGVPPVPPMPTPLSSSGAGTGLMSPSSGSGTRNVRGPRPPPIAVTSPAISAQVSRVGENNSLTGK